MLAVAATIEATAATVPMTVLQGGDRGDESRNQINARKAVAATLRAFDNLLVRRIPGTRFRNDD